MSGFLLNEEETRRVIVQALVQSMTPDKVEALVQGAIMQLLEPRKDRWGTVDAKAKTPLQDAFEDQVARHAAELVKAMLQEPARMQQLREAVVAGWEKFIADSDKIAGAVTRTLYTLFDKDR